MFFNCYKITVFLVLFCASITIEAQEFTTIDNVTNGTKLQDHNILSIVQDSRGFLWVATNWRLYKYDGYTFKSYNLNTSNPSVNNNIKTLLVDGDNLWIGTKNGITILNTLTNTSQKLKQEENHELTSNYVTKLFKDISNNIWVLYYDNKISKYLGNFKFQNFELQINNFDTCFSSNEIIETKPNTFYIKMICETQYVKYINIIEAKYDGNKLTTKVINENISENVAMFKIKDTLHLIDKNNHYKFNEVSGSFKLMNSLFKQDTVKSSTSFVDKSNNIFIGTQNNSFYSIDTKTFQPHNYTAISREGISVNTFFEDNSGLLWIGTTAGLYKIKRKDPVFEKQLLKPFIGNANKINSIIQDEKGTIYAINQTNLYKYNTIKKEFINLKWENKNNEIPLSLLENDENTLLMGTKGNGLIIYNKNTNVCKPFLNSNQILHNKNVVKLFRDKHNILWIGTLEGLYYFDKRNDSLIKINTFNLNDVSENNESIFEIKPFNENELWIGTNSGLFKLKIEYLEFPLKTQITKIDNIPNSVRSILINKDILWIATHSQGILKYNTRTLKVNEVNETNGLSGNSVYSVLPGAQNEIWFGTSNGLSRYDTISKLFLNYYVYDGLVDNEFNTLTQLKARNGELFFGGRNGISNFSSNFKTDSKNFNLNISTISWYNSKIDSTFIIDVNNNKFKPLVLPFNNAFVNFEFSLSDYFKPKNNTFKYRLTDLYENWRDLKKTNVLSFSNIPPGEYNLEVIASTNYGKWNTQKISIPIIVTQVYYKRFWFLIASGVLILLFFYFIRRYELSHIRKLERLRLQISRDLHDELGSSLTGIAIRSELLKEKIGTEAKDKVLDEIALQSRSAVDSLSDIVWAIDSSNNSVQNLSERMETILYLLLKPLNITFTFENLQESKPLYLKQDYRQHVFLIFKEAITNIVKHSNATHVKVEFSKEKDKIKLKICDNGTSFQECDNKLNGHGIQNMRMRANKIKASLKINIDNGCMVEILFNYLN